MVVFTFYTIEKIIGLDETKMVNGVLYSTKKKQPCVDIKKDAQ